MNLPQVLDSLRLIQFSDCHLFADRNKTGYAEINPSSSLARVLAQIAQESADIVLLTGDISGDYSAQSYQHLQALWLESGITAPLISLPGNHDDIAHWQQSLQDIHVLSSHQLNSHWRLHRLPSSFTGANGEVYEAALQRLEQRLLVDNTRQHIVVLHHPPQDSGVWMDKHRLLNAPLLQAMLKRVNNVPLLIHGHVHTERQSSIGNTTVLACPSTCWQWGNTPEFSVSNLSPGYRMVELQPNGKWYSDVIYC